MQSHEPESSLIRLGDWAKTRSDQGCRSFVILEKASRVMRSFIRNYVQAEKARREESGEAGFSLIELIVVVVILGILAAVAIPVFLGLQAQSEKTAQDAVAGNAASQAAAKIAKDGSVTDADLANLEDGTYTVTVANGDSLDTFCVTVTGGADGWTSKSGPASGCTSAATTGS